MQFSGMLRHVALVRTEVLEELSASFISELGTMIAVTSIVLSSLILVTLMKEALSSSETSVLTRATRHNIPEDAILHSHRRENLKSYNITVLEETNRCYHISVHLLCRNTATCFIPVRSSSCYHYMKMLFITGLFTDMD
jgi:hypothetical protein